MAWLVGVVREPPPEEGGRMVDGPAVKMEAGPAELGLVVERRRGPLGRAPHEAQGDEQTTSTWVQRILVAFMAPWDEAWRDARQRPRGCIRARGGSLVLNGGIRHGHRLDWIRSLRKVGL